MLTVDSPDQPIPVVRRVVDYEPPLAELRRCPRLPAAARRPAARTPGSRDRGNPASGMSVAMRPAAAFAEGALRRVLEVIDRRRSPAQLRPLLAATLVDSVLAANRLTAARQVAAVLRRVRLQAVGGRDASGAATAAEVFATYSRGPRVHAIACRVEQIHTSSGPRWQVVALHIG
jgi:hypothetical protein